MALLERHHYFLTTLVCQDNARPGVLPSPCSVYPSYCTACFLTLHLFSSTLDQPLAKACYEFVRSPEGLVILKQMGLIKLKRSEHILQVGYTHIIRSSPRQYLEYRRNAD